METYVVDAFTGTPFRGNPAGVVVLEEPAEDSWMRAVAAELKHSETAFVVAGVPEGRPKPLRWFSPTTEVDLCGHATLATAHVLGGQQRFDTSSGELTCEDLGNGWIGLDFPADPPDVTEVSAELAAGLPGITIERVARGSFDVLVRAGSAAEVRSLVPDLEAIARVPVRGVIVTAPGDSDGIDFVSRFFAPRYGMPEDPVTGSAHCTLASWWSAELERSEQGTEFVGEQASPRGGVVRTTLRGARVGLCGSAVTTLKGQIVV
ncbi:putative PhzF superfamily epimerase YddE/YHI9 [Actinopolyspora biskrensis]|uniref:Putative PhzF superfamily epimerase YddE/YHI9 n=1 Tax=Actinopolyspora biskrensis TaxID=1470178 RepID=A0A852Z4P4_9ACTN|nr:PhzF family phenazine biosynthesis protein [Actinopolyspora biskrensis]NYH77337.1 putative PhzF superfamily epimerase YddE/YHI9 [Actinopolyspora biskrensis]